MSQKIKLLPCRNCGKYPHPLKVYDDYKYVCNIQCDKGTDYLATAGFWHSTKNGARRAWNKRMSGEYA